jgi:O-antigen ligase
MLLLKLEVSKFLRILFFGSLFFPIILVSVSFLISESDYLEAIMRSKNDLLTGNNRFFIWAFVLEELSNFKFMHLVGYGELGHYGSKLSYEWMDFFKYSYDSPEKAASSHNTILQLILDTGYLGLVIYLAIIYKSFHHNVKLWKESGNFFNLIIPFFIIYINIVGTTEAYFTDLSSIVVFFLIMLFGLIFNNSYETKNH